MLRTVLGVGLPALVLWLLTVSITFANPRKIPTRAGAPDEPPCIVEPERVVEPERGRESTAVRATSRPRREAPPERVAPLPSVIPDVFPVSSPSRSAEEEMGPRGAEGLRRVRPRTP